MTETINYDVNRQERDTFKTREECFDISLLSHSQNISSNDWGRTHSTQSHFSSGGTRKLNSM